jgi:membrane protein DedA with SNARE-associated domain
MFDDLVKNIAQTLQNTDIPVLWILILAFVITLTENIFPPSPSDVILVLLGSLVGLDKVGFVDLLITATIGSTMGFILMYWLGALLGNKIIDSKKFKFINEENLEKPRKWFLKYGYSLIAINRFLPGTRAVISFFAGISRINLKITIILCFVSAAIWNIILIYLGNLFGRNWEIVNNYMSLYGSITTYSALGIIVLFGGYKLYIYLKNRKSVKNSA